MNIKQAKDQIKNAIVAYFTKDEFGQYRIPIERQRPVFLIGPPGIGKTAIMEQIAEELNVGLVSYSMTHHTRQSALGLPFIKEETYDGHSYRISEYTMSEIIATVYEEMKKTGLKEGILFLDEMNCVSETLAPSMLQFLQYKVFGGHRVPDGWIVVTAGNPPEYNKSVREFDVVTWDRLKKIVIEPDYEIWNEYAINKGVHTAITTYLSVKTNNFYSIETTVDGKSFVTARGWVDLSDMIKLYEENNLPVDLILIEQYLQNNKIAKDFALYYELYNKYKADYQINEILEGNISPNIKERAVAAAFDERLALVSLLLDAILVEIRDVMHTEVTLTGLLEILKGIKASMLNGSREPLAIIEEPIQELRAQIENQTMTQEKKYELQCRIAALENDSALVVKNGKTENGKEAFPIIKEDFSNQVKAMHDKAAETSRHLSNIFAFADEVFGSDSQELLVFVSNLTVNKDSATFISHYGNEAYFAHNDALLFYERQRELITELGELTLEFHPSMGNDPYKGHGDNFNSNLDEILIEEEEE